MLLPEDEPPLAPLGALGLFVVDDDPEEPVEEPPMPELELEGLELEGLELEDVPPVALDFWPASHSERESLPSWSLSSLSNSPDEELDEDDEPPAAEDVLEGADVPPAEDEDGEDDLLLCDIDGEALESDELFDVSAA